MTYGRARGQMPSDLDGLLASQVIQAISEARLGVEDEKIARLYYIDRIAQMDIAAELYLDRSTVSRRLKSNINPRLRNAANHLPQ